MIRGPTSSVTINSTSPLLRRRLCFQPLYSTFSTVIFPWSAAADGRGSQAARPRPTARKTAGPRHKTEDARTGLSPHRSPRDLDGPAPAAAGRAGDGLGKFLRGGRRGRVVAGLPRQFLAADDRQVHADLHGDGGAAH